MDCSKFKNRANPLNIFIRLRDNNLINQAFLSFQGQLDIILVKIVVKAL
jgi:hypothetical protein